MSERVEWTPEDLPDWPQENYWTVQLGQLKLVVWAACGQAEWWASMGGKIKIDQGWTSGRRAEDKAKACAEAVARIEMGDD